MAAEGTGPDGADERAPLVLDPTAQRVTEAWSSPPWFHRLGPQDGRRVLADIQDDVVGGPDVDAEFRVAPVGPRGLVGFWLVRPAVRSGEPLPVVLYVHGGRWMIGDADTHGRLVRDLAVGSGSAFVVPEYTRTPEARYPVAVEEIYALLLWVTEHAVDLDVRGDRTAVAGDCAGATLALAAALLATRRAGPRLRAQVLYYPWLDPAPDGEDDPAASAGEAVLSREAVRWYWDQYGGDADPDDPILAPVRAEDEDLTGLPRTLVITAEADVLRDDAERFAARLREVGVEVLCSRYLGVTHDFVALRPLRAAPPAAAAVRQGAAFLAEALGPGR
jgi:acetyl esterase/lipase